MGLCRSKHHIPRSILLKKLESIINVLLFRFPTSIIPNHCKAYTVSLQSLYRITAKPIQHHCKAYAVSLQSLCSVAAKHMQQHCNTDATLHCF